MAGPDSGGPNQLCMIGEGLGAELGTLLVLCDAQIMPVEEFYHSLKPGAAKSDAESVLKALHALSASVKVSLAKSKTLSMREARLGASTSSAPI